MGRINRNQPLNTLLALDYLTAVCPKPTIIISSRINSMKPQSKESLIRIFNFGGILGLVVSLIHLYGGLTDEFTSVIVGDIAINMIFSQFSFLSAWFVKQEKQAVIYLVIIWMLTGIVYGFAIGRGVNFIIIIACGFFLWQLFSLRKQGKLSH